MTNWPSIPFEFSRYIPHLLLKLKCRSYLLPLAGHEHLKPDLQHTADFGLLRQIDATFKANSGHPGAPMGMAPVAHVMFNKFMTFNPSNPDWVNRDRFILS